MEMSAYKNHWSRESNESTTIDKLVEKRLYEIIDVEKLKTQFGTKFILVTDTGFKYWTNKINEFITSNNSIKKFHLETLEAKTFKSKKGM